MIYSVIGRTSKSRYITFMFILSFILIYVWSNKYCQISTRDGFSQDKPFILKRDDEIYDSFYAHIYKKIHNPKNQIEFISDEISKLISKSTSIRPILVISSDTGEMWNHFHQKGYNVFTIFKSKYIAKYATLLYPNLKTTIGDIETPMMYEKSTFSSILCYGHSLYRIKDKKKIFQNLHSWLEPNGKLFIHLYERSKFNTITSSANKFLIDSPQKYHNERITQTNIDFGSFKYSSKYDFKNTDSKNTVYFSETFTDTRSNNVRQQEQTLYMEKIIELLSILKYCGFNIIGKFDFVEDKYQFVYILQKI